MDGCWGELYQDILFAGVCAGLLKDCLVGALLQYEITT